jgi:hypothetical protein
MLVEGAAGHADVGLVVDAGAGEVARRHHHLFDDLVERHRRGSVVQQFVQEDPVLVRFPLVLFPGHSPLPKDS